LRHHVVLGIICGDDVLCVFPIVILAVGLVIFLVIIVIVIGAVLRRRPTSSPSRFEYFL